MKYLFFLGMLIGQWIKQVLTIDPLAVTPNERLVDVRFWPFINRGYWIFRCQRVLDAKS
jgi:hypothetical protein